MTTSDYDEYEEHEIAKLRLSEQQMHDFNKVLMTLARVPVVRLGQEDTRKELLFSERLIIARTLVPIMDQVREDERRRQSTDDGRVEPEVLLQGPDRSGEGSASERYN